MKLVRGEGSTWLDRITHVGAENWEPVGDDLARASTALKRLLKRLNLGRRRLGHVAVAVGGEQSSTREVLLPTLSEEELRQALPFEAKRHLPLEGVPAPVVAFQILGTASSDEAGSGQMRVLLAAVAGTQRSFVLQVLSRAGIEPEAIDLEPLAQLNALMAVLPSADGDPAVGLLDLGARQISLHISQRSGGLLTRVLGPGLPSNGLATPPEEQALAKLAARIRETMTFYRGRYRQEVSALFAGGGGALATVTLEGLQSALGFPVSPLDPIGELAQKAEKTEDLPAAAPRFVTACGLCRRWDRLDV